MAWQNHGAKGALSDWVEQGLFTSVSLSFKNVKNRTKLSKAMGFIFLPALFLLQPCQATSFSIALPGRLSAPASYLKPGVFLVPCEDRVLYVLDHRAQLITQLKVEDRFAFSPSVLGSFVAISLLSGKVMMARFEANQKTLVPLWTKAQNTIPSAPPAWNNHDQLYVAFLDGTIQKWNIQGKLVEEYRAPSPALTMLIDPHQGLYAGCDKKFILWKKQGQESQSFDLPGRPLGMAQSSSGRIYVYGKSWVRSFFKDHELSGLEGIKNILLGPRGQVILVLQNKVKIVDADLNEIFHFSLPRPSLAKAVLDRRGRILIPTLNGIEHWTLKGRLVESNHLSLFPLAPLLSDDGTLCLSSQDWKIHFLPGFSLMPFGWPQDGADSGRSFLSFRPISLKELSLQWEQSPRYIILNQKLQSDDLQAHKFVIDQIEAKIADGTLAQDWPFAPILLLKITHLGLTELKRSYGRLVNACPINRIRAYRLLTGFFHSEIHDELISLLQMENDPSVQNHMIDAIAQLGYDANGELVQLLNAIQKKRPYDTALGYVLLKASQKLYKTNGHSTDQAVLELLQSLGKNPYPSYLQKQAQQFLQNIVASSF